MAILHPFRALRPKEGFEEEIASVPYDVISVAEARELAEGKPFSFLHVIRPEIDCPEGTDEHDDIVYEMGARNLEAFKRSDRFVQEEDPSLYIYRLIMDGREQTGIFGCVGVKDYDEGVIVKHENTRPVKEKDRTRHILTQEAHAEPVMLTFRDDDEVNRLMQETMEGEPLYDFEAEDGVQHTVWQVTDPDRMVQRFRAIERLYIADGHHRCKAASLAAKKLREERDGDDEEFMYFPAVLFPMGNMHIMAYNRIVANVPQGQEQFADELVKKFEVEKGVSPVPEERGRIALYLGDEWYGLELPPTEQDSVAAKLDVARLGEHILDPMLGIEDPRRDSNIDFVGGIRGTEELEERVDSGEAELAISMYPTQIEDLVAVSDAGELMPPKSTWFEPKLRSGLLIHVF